MPRLTEPTRDRIIFAKLLRKKNSVPSPVETIVAYKRKQVAVEREQTQPLPTMRLNHYHFALTMLKLGNHGNNILIRELTPGARHLLPGSQSATRTFL